jgi:glycerol-3-phosphate dehydrogenase
VTGGKLTTYRRMAADAVDEVVALLGRSHMRSRTARLPIVGGSMKPAPPVRGGVLGVPSIRDHLLRRYGTEAPAVAALADADPDLALPLVPGLPYLRAEAIWAVRAEMATALEDVVARRTRAWILDRAATTQAAPAIAALLAPELGWDQEREDAEVAGLLESAEIQSAETTG